jgi:hypothetical protein
MVIPVVETSGSQECVGGKTLMYIQYLVCLYVTRYNMSKEVKSPHVGAGQAGIESHKIHHDVDSAFSIQTSYVCCRVVF